MFFVGMSEKTHPGFRDWLSETCQQAGFTPRVLQDAELEPALMTFVADGLGVSLAREHIKKLPHPGVAFRPSDAAGQERLLHRLEPGQRFTRLAAIH